MGLFNPRAFFLSDINLLFQSAILLVLIISMLLRSRRSYSAHGATIGTAVVLHTISIFAIMEPSFAVNARFLGNLMTTAAAAIILHAALGSLVEVVGVYLVISWALHRWDVKVCSKNRRLMNATLIAWLGELALGILVYILLYPPF